VTGTATPGTTPPTGTGTIPQPPTTGTKPPGASTVPSISWKGEVPPQKWMNFYTKVLSKFSTGSGLKLTLRVDVAPPEGVSTQKVDETKVALRELGLNDELDGE
jgi:hypothetical protein